MSGTRPIELLRAVAAAAQDGRPLPPEVAGWLAAGVSRYVAERGRIGLDGALGLGRPGARGWWTVLDLERRNQLLIQYWRQELPGLSPGQAAEEIKLRLRFRPTGLLLEAVMCGQSIPGTRQLKQILKGAGPNGSERAALISMG